MNREVNILGKSFYSPSLKDVAWLETFQIRFNNIQATISQFIMIA